jgi:hypothetical protein
MGTARDWLHPVEYEYPLPFMLGDSRRDLQSAIRGPTRMLSLEITKSVLQARHDPVELYVDKILPSVTAEKATMSTA